MPIYSKGLHPPPSLPVAGRSTLSDHHWHATPPTARHIVVGGFWFLSMLDASASFFAQSKSAGFVSPAGVLFILADFLSDSEYG